MNEYSLQVLGSGPALALAHGAGGGVIANFGELCEHMAERTLTGLDYPGSGDRPVATDPLTVASLADELVTTQVRSGHERFPILGLSLGSTVAITAAARYPDRVSGLILTVGMGAADSQGSNFASLFTRLTRAERWVDLARVMLVSVASPATLAALDPAAVDALIAATVDNLRLHASALLPQMELVQTVDVRAQAAALDLPTLVIGAGQDRIVLPQTTRDLAGMIPGAEFAELPGAGHIFTVDETPIWADLITDFLGRHDL